MRTWNQRVAEIKARLRAASGPGFSGAEHEDTHEERWGGRVIIGEGWWESDVEYPNERADAVFLTHAYDDIADLLSENERLRSECAVITDDMVERAGSALFQCMFGGTRTAEAAQRLWDSKEISGATREDYRRRARAALEAALNTRRRTVMGDALNDKEED